MLWQLFKTTTRRSPSVAVKQRRKFITADFTGQFEDATADIADEAMTRLAETDEVFAESDAVLA